MEYQLCEYVSMVLHRIKSNGVYALEIDMPTFMVKPSVYSTVCHSLTAVELKSVDIRTAGGVLHRLRDNKLHGLIGRSLIGQSLMSNGSRLRTDDLAEIELEIDTLDFHILEEEAEVLVGIFSIAICRVIVELRLLALRAGDKRRLRRWTDNAEILGILTLTALKLEVAANMFVKLSDNLYRHRY
jgi:hypothetical protein